MSRNYPFNQKRIKILYALQLEQRYCTSYPSVKKTRRQAWVVHGRNHNYHNLALLMNQRVKLEREIDEEGMYCFSTCVTAEVQCTMPVCEI